MSQVAAARAVALFGAMALVSGTVGAALERGWPPASDVRAVEAFVQSNRSAILGQSMAFSASATACVGFFAGLRFWLGGAADRQPVLSTAAFGGGLVWASLQIAGQALQTGMALASSGSLQPSVLWAAFFVS